MKKHLRKIISITTVVITAIVCLVFSAQAASILGSGKCGDNLTWTVYDDLSMKITGTGPMYDYSEGNTNKEWDKYGDIRRVTVESGVTRIGKCAFLGNESITYIYLPDTVEEIGYQAFMNSKIKTVDGSPKLKKIEHLAFAYSSLSSITLPEGLEYIGNSAFESTDITQIRIPSTVKTIEEFCFSMTQLSKVEIAEGVEKIPRATFSQCFYLSSISLPSTLKTIGDSAFYRCSALRYLTIPKNVSTIGQNPFTRCTVLSLSLCSENTYFKIKNGALYTSDMKEIICYPSNNSSDAFVIDSATEIINGSCFEANTMLKSIVLPDNLKVIEYGAFDKCTSLEIVDIPDTVEEIQTVAFSECSKARLKLPANIKEIGYGAFYNCDSFEATNLYLPDTLKTIGNTAFLNCDSITELSIGSSIEQIGEGAFSYCNNLNTVTFRDGFKSIEIYDGSSGVFEGSGSLKNIYLPKTVLKIGNHFFEKIPGLEKIALPVNLTDIGTYAFYQCTALKEISFSGGNSLKEIGHSAFSYCSSLKSIDLSTFSNLRINNYAFSSCTNLSTVKSGNYHYTISEDSFANTPVTDGTTAFYMGTVLVRGSDSSTGEFTIKSGTTDIFTKAFANFSLLKKITVPASVTYIGTNAFMNCSALKEIYYDGSLYKWEKLVGSNTLTDVTIHTTSNYIYENDEFTLDAEGIMRLLIKGEMEDYHIYIPPVSKPNIAYGNGSIWCRYNSNVKVLQFVNAITRIGNYAFDNMYNLATFTIPSSVKSIGYKAFDRTAYSDNAANWSGGVLYKDNCALDVISDNNEALTFKAGTRIIADNGNTAQVNAIRISGIKKISVPASVENIGCGFATGYEDLTTITVNADNKFYTAVNGILLSKDKTEFIKYPEGKSETSYTIPSSVKKLTDYSFALSNLEKLYIPASVTQVDYHTFERCYNLKEIYYGGSQEQWEEAIGEELMHSDFYYSTKVYYNYHEHTYSNTCDTNCNICNAERSIEHTYSNACDKSCNVCGATRTPSAHMYDNSCDKTCNVCNATRTITHTYSNACDKTCNICKETRTVPAHKYTNSCDTTCNVCGAERTIKHTYTNSCDKTCNVCSAKRSTKHTYTNSCDKTCNVCKAARKITHSYKTTTTKATLSKNGKTVKKCTICGYVSKTTTIYYPKTIKLSKREYIYNGKIKTPSVTVKDSEGNILKKDTDYTVKYSSGRKSIGKYTVTITFKGKYSGTKKLTFKIVLGKVSLSKVTAGNKSATPVWNTVSGASGYEVKYSTSSKFKNAKTATVKKGASKKKTIKKLTKGKKYYFKIRAYKIVDGKKVYGAWSTVKSVKIK